MTQIMTWEECARAGMSAKEAAKHKNRSIAAAYAAANTYGFRFETTSDRRLASLRASAAAGLTVAEAAKAANCDISWAYVLKRKHGLRFERHEVRKIRTAIAACHDDTDPIEQIITEAFRSVLGRCPIADPIGGEP